MFLNLMRDRMAEMIGNGNLLGVAKSGETDTGTTTVEISVLDDFEDKITISKVICEPAPELERCQGLTTVQTKEEPLHASPPPPIENLLLETKAPIPTAAQPGEPKPQWTVGAQCQAVWSEDGRVYAASIQSIEGERCRVRFEGYGNEEDLPLSTLKPPELQPKTTQEWRAGSRCRARFSDGLTYPAAVAWVHGRRCGVRRDHADVEEELDVSSLLSPDELYGPGRTGRGATWRPSFGGGVRRRREVPDVADKREAERGGRDRVWREPQHGSWPSKERVPSQSREDREPEERRPSDRPFNPTFLPFASFPPPPFPHVPGDGPPYVPPPPPFWAFGAKEPSAALDPTSHMLMLWYMCGFHTGSYLAQQPAKSSTRD